MDMASKWRTCIRVWTWLKTIDYGGRALPKSRRFRKLFVTARAAPVGSCSQASWSESTSVRHRDDWNADADLSQFDSGDHSVAKDLWRQFACETTTDAWAVCLLLR